MKRKLTKPAPASSAAPCHKTSSEPATGSLPGPGVQPAAHGGLPGEDPAYRAEISKQLYEEIAPKGVVEKALVDDAIDALCEVEVWSRQRATLLEAYRHDGVRTILEPFYGILDLNDLVDSWRRGQAQALEVVTRRLVEQDPDGTLVTMHTLRHRKDLFDWVHTHLIKARNARHIVFRELERRRLLRAQLQRSLCARDADAIALLPPEPYIPIFVPGDDDPLGQPYRAAKAEVPPAAQQTEHEPEAITQADATAEPASSTGLSSQAQSTASPSDPTGEGALVLDCPDAAPARGCPSRADPLAGTPAQPSAEESRSAEPRIAPSQAGRQFTPPPSRPARGAGPGSAVRTPRRGGTA